PKYNHHLPSLISLITFLYTTTTQTIYPKNPPLFTSFLPSSTPSLALYNIHFLSSPLSTFTTS
ncbi:hypothetical protein, partial [Bacillus altitudinis]|uniref:hypothetical protein n=1 Tax=Bacillus altitudinis TaxID=293387 RepID=UPI001C93193E